jgi:hypothetical protein
MPNPTITTSYAGNDIGKILQLSVVGNEAVKKGSFYIHEDVQKEKEITRGFVSDNIIQEYQAMPTVPSNALSFTPRKLAPKKMMIYDLINPMDFQSFWEQYQPEGPLADKVLNRDIQRVILEMYTKKSDNQLGRIIWQGNTAAGATSPLRFFNGIVTTAIADSTVIDVTPAGVITESNVIAVLTACDSAIPDALYEDPTMIIHMNTGDFRKYQNAIIAKTYKGQGEAEKVPAIFKGREIRTYSGFPANYIMVAKADTNPINTALHMGVNMVNDPENLKLERWRPEGDLYFLKASFMMDVNYAFGEEIVLYQPA